MSERLQARAEDVLLSFSDEIRTLCFELRSLVLDCVANANERVFPGWKVLTYSLDDELQQVCAISIHKNHLDLIFSQGAHLDDPDGLLEGVGKRVRHIKIRPASGIPEAAVRRLIAQAVEIVKA